MTDWRDPDVVNAEYLAFIKLLHVMGGLYIWEYVTTFGFEWSVITRKRKYRWTIWLYSGCRLSALTAIVVIFIGFNVTKPINCEAWLVCVFLFAYTAILFASALIILRIYAIWDRNLHITALAVVAWLTNAAFYLHNIIMSRSVWNPESPGCVVLYTDRSRENVIVTLVTDMVQLVLMLWGLVRYGNAGTFNGLWRLLYNQGLLWLVIVTVAEIPPTVFIVLNLNDPLNLMFQTPELIIMSIGATRIYRALADYGLMTEFNVVSERSEPSTNRARNLLNPVRFRKYKSTDGAPQVILMSSLAASTPTEGDSERHGLSFDRDAAQRVASLTPEKDVERGSDFPLSE